MKSSSQTADIGHEIELADGEHSMKSTSQMADVETEIELDSEVGICIYRA